MKLSFVCLCVWGVGIFPLKVPAKYYFLSNGKRETKKTRLKAKIFADENHILD